MIQMKGPLSSGLAVGADGSATANASYPISESGELLGVYVDYKGTTPPSTIDVTIATLGSSVPAYNLFVLTNANTDGLFLPRKAVVDQAGAALTFDGTRLLVDRIPFFDGVKITIAQANAGNSVDIYLLYE